jgi:hypothetical protein
MMTGEKDLGNLLREMKPELDRGEYVFCTVNTMKDALELDPVCIVQEKEAVTIILPKARADENVLYYSSVCAWITLTVHSSLEAVGLTAAFSSALTEADISCNVVAGYYHDHIFVPIRDAERAMEILNRLGKG